jgi:hypothetical protein
MTIPTYSYYSYSYSYYYCYYYYYDEYLIGMLLLVAIALATPASSRDAFCALPTAPVVHIVFGLGRDPGDGQCASMVSLCCSIAGRCMLHVCSGRWTLDAGHTRPKAGLRSS